MKARRRFHGKAFYIHSKVYSEQGLLCTHIQQALQDFWNFNPCNPSSFFLIRNISLFLIGLNPAANSS